MTDFAFSTLGCSGIPLREVAALAARAGYRGVELRVAEGEPVNVDMDASARAAAARTLREYDVIPVSIASYVRIAADDVADSDVVADAVAHGVLAADLGAWYLRVFPGGNAPGHVVAERLEAIVAALDSSGVTIAVETHDSHPTVTGAAGLIADQPDCALIWDVLHPWRSGESVAQSAAALAGRLAYVQVKDVASVVDLTPLAPGEGGLPLAVVAEALAGASYDGWISWEYEQLWFPDCPPLEQLAEGVNHYLRSVFGGWPVADKSGR